LRGSRGFFKKGRRGRGGQRWPTMGRRESRKSVRRNMSRLEVMNRD
jgi:hypothetical protein